MMRARRHRPRARDRPRRAPAIDRYGADSFLESESEPATRARTRSPLARRARESHTHTHTHHRRATSRSRPNDSRRATRASTSHVPSPRVTTSALVASTRSLLPSSYIGLDSIPLRPRLSYSTLRLPIHRDHRMHPRGHIHRSGLLERHPHVTRPPFSPVLHRGKSTTIHFRSTTSRPRASIVHRVFVSRRARAGGKSERDASNG